MTVYLLRNKRRRWLLYLGRSGVGFEHKGDEVIWLWPWRRPSGQPWLSIGFEAVFPSLRAIDLLWDEWEKAEREASMDVGISDSHPMQLGEDVKALYPEQEIQDAILEAWNTGKVVVWNRPADGPDHSEVR